MAQVIKLVGVVDDGTPLGPKVPRNTAREIQFPRLADVRIELDIVNNAGARVSGATALKMTIQSRLVPGAPGPTLLKAGTITDPGTGLILIAGADTQMFQSMRLHFDIWLTVASGAKHQIVRAGIVRLEPNITLAP